MRLRWGWMAVVQLCHRAVALGLEEEGGLM